jgi:capsular polysaccharide biosynthesis protein
MESDIHFYLKVLKRRRILIAFITAVSCLLTFFFSMYMAAPLYQASTKLIINRTQEILDIDSINLNIKLTDVYTEIMRSTSIMEEVIRENPDLNISAEELAKKISISGIPQTPIIRISVNDRSQEQAVRLANTATSVFKKHIPSIMKLDNLTIVNEAKIGDQPAPISPNIPLNVGLSFCIALLCMLWLVYLLEGSNDSFMSEDHIGSVLQLPTLAVIATIKKREARDYKLTRNKKSGRPLNV